MRAIPVLLAVLALACGSVHERSECATSAGCPAGSYCARTADGNVCWPDAGAPAVSGVIVYCPFSPPCLRSATLMVSAVVTDDAELAGVDVEVLGTTVPLSRAAGDVWRVDLPLARFPFPAFEADVVATVTARDAAGNLAAQPAAPVSVTRLRFTKALDTGVFSLTSPAVMEDGTVGIGSTNGKLYIVTWDGTGLTSVSVGTGQISAAPLALSNSIWLGSEDNRLYEAQRQVLSGTWDAASRADVGSPIRGSLALCGGRVIASPSQSGFVFAATSTGYFHSGPGFSSALGTVVDESNAIFMVSGGLVRRFTLVSGAPTADPSFAATVGASVSAPLSVHSTVVVPSDNGAQGFLKRVVGGSSDAETIATTGVPTGSVAILSGGEFLLPQATNTLTRWSSDGVPAAGWTATLLDGEPRTPLVLDSTRAPFVVSTAGGSVVALQPDGTPYWSWDFGTAALQPGNIYTPPGQAPGEVLSTAYFAGADGVLHAVIVDGALDASAPWPKAFHDPRNTNRAGPQP